MFQFIVHVPVSLWLEVKSSDEKLAHFEAIRSYEWICEAIRVALDVDSTGGESFPLSPENLIGYRTLGDFDQALAVRGTLDLEHADQLEVPGHGEQRPHSSSDEPMDARLGGSH